MPKSPHWIWALALFALPARGTEVPTLAMSYCLESAMENNRELIQAREKVRQAEGSRIVVRSRFLPHLELITNYDVTREGVDGKAQDDFAGRLFFSQRLFEFGPDAVQEVSLRSSLRSAVYGYEEQVYQVLARAWELFHLIQLEEEQIATRRESRLGFQKTLERQKARFAQRLATEEDTLIARLNVLNEDLAINNLMRLQFTNKMELLRLIGQPVGTDVQLEGRAPSFALNTGSMPSRSSSSRRAT